MKRALICLALALLLAIMAPRPGYPHGWYDPECCSDSDCKPLPAGAVVQPVPGGYEITPTPGDSPIFFTREKVKPSKDGYFHGCIGPTGIAYCLYVPASA